MIHLHFFISSTIFDLVSLTWETLHSKVQECLSNYNAISNIKKGKYVKCSTKKDLEIKSGGFIQIAVITSYHRVNLIDGEMTKVSKLFHHDVPYIVLYPSLSRPNLR